MAISRHSRNMRSAVAALLCATILTAQAHAADAVPAASTATDDSVIVVTAQKRAQNIQDVPLTIQAFTGTKLDDTGIRSVDDLVLLTPGLTIPRVGSGATPYIRGIGSAQAGGGQETAVATYVDGTYHLDSWAISLDTANVERIEVLKGPQGTLFGRNATGGVINVITKDPSPEFGGEARGYYGDYQRFGGDLYITGAIAEDVSANLSITYQEQNEGFGRNIFPNPNPRYGGHNVNYRDLFSARGKLKWENDDTTVLLSADYAFRRDDGGVASRLFPGSLGVDGALIYGGCIAAPGATDAGCRSAAVAGASRAPDGFYDTNQNLTSQTTVRSWGGYLRINHDFNGVKLLSLSSYRHDTTRQPIDNDHIPVRVTDAAPFLYTSRSFTQELQLSSDNDSRFRWMGGLFYLRATGGADILVQGLGLLGAIPGVAPFGLDSLNLFGKIKTNSYSAFGEIGYELTDQLEITLGARYTRDERRVSGGQTLAAYNGADPADGVTPITVPDDQQKNFQKLTWRAVANYAVTPDVNLYASYNRGFKSGNFNALDVSQPAVKPEVIDAYEAGIKSQFLDRRITLNAAGFYYDYANLQLLVPSGVGTRLENAAKARIKGIELDANIRASDRITLYGGFSRLWTEYLAYPAAATYAPTGFGGNMLVIQDVSGNRLAKTPKLTFNLGGTVNIPTRIGTFGSSVNWSYNDGFNWDPDGRLKQPSYSLVNATIGWTSLDEMIGFKLIGRNLTKAKYCVFCTAVGTADLFAAGQPRTITAELTFKF